MPVEASKRQTRSKSKEAIKKETPKLLTRKKKPTSFKLSIPKEELLKKETPPSVESASDEEESEEEEDNP